MRYQLVLQMQGDSPAHYDALLALEQRLSNVLDDASEVDGHDIGSGESNIFIMTNDPQQAFAQSRPTLESAGLLGSVCAAFRDLTEDNYTVIWPLDHDGKFAIA